ncbi:hypothetical protein L596_001980 [Steinernema carpocapsae]|uniref:Globin domain-containing protein n=1 Tax=Steinernema carpocapsae TaxID=34508 RepID=A0A4U8UMP6_STECR|nr:hypothetical protein L596_001980 [Steinernema carpocapsae]
MWPQFRAIQDSALVSSDQLRRHVQIYMKGLHNVIGAMDDEAELTRILRRIADAHARHGVHQFHVHVSLVVVNQRDTVAHILRFRTCCPNLWQYCIRVFIRDRLK